MLISVVIPTLGRESLKGCLQTLFEQNYPKDFFEVIVVEDGSFSTAKELTVKLGFTYFWQNHKGPAAARNRGVRKARGEVVAFTDDDCLLPSNWLEKLVDGYRRYLEAAGVGGYMEARPEVLLSNPYAQYESYMTHQVYRAGSEEILGGFEVPTGGTNNISYRRKIIEEFGGFDETFPAAAGEDADFKKRVCDAGYRLLYLPLGVTHNHDYSWSSFIKQSRDRGLGSLYFHKKHKEGLTRKELFLGLFFSPFDFIKSLFLTRITLRVALLRWLASVVNYTTQWRFYGKR